MFVRVCIYPQQVNCFPCLHFRRHRRSRWWQEIFLFSHFVVKKGKASDTTLFFSLLLAVHVIHWLSKRSSNIVSAAIVIQTVWIIKDVLPKAISRLETSTSSTISYRKMAWYSLNEEKHVVYVVNKVGFLCSFIPCSSLSRCRDQKFFLLGVSSFPEQQATSEVKVSSSRPLTWHEEPFHRIQ